MKPLKGKARTMCIDMNHSIQPIAERKKLQKEVTEQHVYYSPTYILLYSLENTLQIFSRGYLFPTCNFTVNFFPFT